MFGGLARTLKGFYLPPLITNFHWPKSTLMLLVAALSGRERILAAYEYGFQERMRLFSYGDGMLIL